MPMTKKPPLGVDSMTGRMNFFCVMSLKPSITEPFHLDFFKNDEDFFMTYGDGLSNVDLNKLLNLHQKNKFIATLTSISQNQKLSKLKINKNKVLNFYEKPKEDFKINGGFFVLSTHVLDLIDGDDCIWEAGPLKALVRKGELGAYVHRGFWQPMDTLREKHILNELWSSNKAPWKIW